MLVSGPKAKRLRPEHTKRLLHEDNEDRLTKNLFTDNHVVLEEPSEDGDTVIEQEVSSKSVWHDEDDANDGIQIPTSKSSMSLQRSADSGGCITADKYQNRLRKAFEQIQHCTPKWAKLELMKQKTIRKTNDFDDELEDVLDEMTRSAQRFISKDPFPVKDIVPTIRCPDITVGHHDTRPIDVVLFHNVRPIVLTAGHSGRVQLFRVGNETDSGNFLQNIQFANFPITSMSFVHGGCSVVCGSIRQDYLMKYDLEKGSVMQLYLPKCIPRQNAGRFAVSYDGSLLALIAYSSQIHVLSSSSMELVKTLSAPTNVTSLQFLPGSSRELWAMTESGEVVIYSLRESHCQHEFRDEGAVRGTKIRLSPHGTKVACGSNTGVVNVYDVSEVRNSANPKPTTVVSNLLTSCDSIAFNHDSQVMALSSNVKLLKVFQKNQIKLLHVARSTVLNNFPKKHERMTKIECSEFSPHSAYLGIGCSNGQLIMERLIYFDDY